MKFKYLNLHTKFDVTRLNILEVDRLNWAGLVVRMDQQRTAKKILYVQPEGRPRKLRWVDGVDSHVEILREI
jgi:hypothetical protein